MAMRDDLAQSAEEQNIKTIRILRTTQAADVKEMVKEFFRFIGSRHSSSGEDTGCCSDTERADKA